MKKLIVVEVIILVLLIGVALFFVSDPARLQTDPAVTENTPGAVSEPPPQTESAAPSAEPTEEPTAPPETEPPETEPPVVVEMEDNWAEVLENHTITAGAYFVYDINSGVFLELSEGITDTPIYPASITKLWAAYVALQYIDPEDTVTVGSELSMIDADSSLAHLQQGDTLTAEQLVAAMLLPSGNDATYVLATEVGRILMNNPDMRADWAIERFVYQMNSLARNKGMKESNFITPDGIHDEEHYISATDMLIIGRLSLENPVIAKYAASVTQTVTLSNDRSLTWKNTNSLLNPDSQYYCSYAVGLKTGFTTPAGNCLLSAFQVGDRQLLIGVFECPGSNDRFADTLLLFTQAFDLEVPEAEESYDQAA